MAASKADSSFFRRVGLAALGWLASLLIRVHAWSLRFEIVNREHLDAALESRRPIIFASWHNNILALLLIRFHLQLPQFVTMISRSKDGDLASALASGLSFVPIRASSSRGGAAGLLEFRNRIRELSAGGQGVAAFHALDGPRGPRHVSKPGVLSMARHTGALLVPVAVGAAPRHRFASWDRFMAPLPFARCVYVFGPPIDVSPTAEATEKQTSEALSLLHRPDFTLEDLDATLRDLALSHPLAARDETP